MAHGPAKQDDAETGLTGRVTRWLALAGGVLLFCAIGVTLVSVTGRYLFSAPLPGDYEVVEILCAVAVFLFFPYTHLTGGNITAEFFTAGLPRRAQRALDLVNDVIFALAALVLAWRLGAGLVNKLQTGEVSILIGIPIWWGFVVAVLSMALLAIVCLWRIARGVRRLRGNR